MAGCEWVEGRANSGDANQSRQRCHAECIIKSDSERTSERNERQPGELISGKSCKQRGGRVESGSGVGGCNRQIGGLGNGGQIG